MKISFIGFGNMAKAIAHSLGHQNTKYQLFAASPSLKEGERSDGLITHPDNLAIIKDANIVILAVKPAKMAAVLAQIKTALPKECLLVSVVAGITLAWIEQQCREGQAIVRSMPNIPIAVQKGATALIANHHTSREQKHWAEQLFQCSGIITWVIDEKEIDAFTALSGSGPAYIFLFLEAMIDAAKKLGLDEDVAKKFTLQTAAGALSLAANSNLKIRELRKKVTSPAGTTAAAIDILQQQGFSELLFRAITAAHQRAKELEIPPLT